MGNLDNPAQSKGLGGLVSAGGVCRVEVVTLEEGGFVSSVRNPLIDADGDHDGAGLRAGIRAAIHDAGPLLPLRDADQLDLLADGGEVKIHHVHAAERGRGRPTGVRNKRTEEVRSYILRRYAHPLEFLAQVWSRPVDMLASELNCTKKEAAFLQVRAAGEGLPYLEGKMPIAIDLTAKGDFNLLIPGINITHEDAALALTGDFIPYDEYSEALEGEASLVSSNEEDA